MPVLLDDEPLVVFFVKIILFSATMLHCLSRQSEHGSCDSSSPLMTMVALGGKSRPAASARGYQAARS
jgi:hypothetical protein